MFLYILWTVCFNRCFLTNSDFITFILSTEGERDAVVAAVVVVAVAVVVLVVSVGGFCN